MDFMAVLQELREHVGQDPRSHAAIARAAGIHPKTFSAFMNQRRGLSVDTTEKLAEALGLAITLTRSGSTPKGRTQKAEGRKRS